MYEPFANKSEWEYKRDTLNPYTGVYDLYLRNGSDPEFHIIVMELKKFLAFLGTIL